MISIKRNIRSTLFFSLLLCILSGTYAADNNKQNQTRKAHPEADSKMQWWREARFGLFVHYGLYSQCEGYWNNQAVKGIGEWIFKIGKIPVSDYHQLTQTFSAENLDVDEWVRLAKEAGMKYAVLTAKHHDGFALFHSKVDTFNVVDATPYGKDIVKQFVEACKKYGLRIGFYYSQFQDWSVPGAGGNDWEPGYAYTKEGFEHYMHKKALPQVRELLSNYGKIDMIWYDTPIKMTKEQSQAFLDLAKELQPEIIVSGRVGNNLGDYVQMEDNNLPKSRKDFDWEVPVTMNHTWAYKRDDNHWKSSAYLLWQLTHSISMNGNYLLNIGPKGDGSVPQASVRRLEEIAAWMRVNGEAVRGTKPSPYKIEFDWGNITRNKKRLYLNITNWPEKGILALHGFHCDIAQAFWLKNKIPVNYKRDRNYLLFQLPNIPVDTFVSVLVVDIENDVRVDETLAQDYNGSIILETELATNTTGAKVRFGSLNYYFKPKGELSWDFKVTRAGTYKIELITTGRKFMARPEDPAAWDGGHKVDIVVDKHTISTTIRKDRIEKAPRDLYNDFKVTESDTITISETGRHTLTLIPIEIKKQNKAGFTLRMIRLVPLERQ